MGKGTKHARDWAETPLQVIIDAMNLYKHSVHIMGNPKNFDPKNDFNNETLYLIQRELLHLYVTMRTANKIDVRRFPDRAEDRLALQREAMTSCDLLLAYFDLAKTQFHLDKGQFWNWMEMLVKVANKLAAWHKTDVARYGEKDKAPLPVAFANGASVDAGLVSASQEGGAELDTLGLQPVAALA